MLLLLLELLLKLLLNTASSSFDLALTMNSRNGPSLAGVPMLEGPFLKNMPQFNACLIYPTTKIFFFCRLFPFYAR